MKPRTLSALSVLLLSFTPPALAADWPQWRGPERNDISHETGLLKEWPQGGPKLLWTYKDAGVGYSCPAIIGDTLYTMGGDGDKEFVYALDLKTRDRLWTTEIGNFFKNGNGDGPRATPTIDGDRLYVLTGPGELACLELATGKKVWSRNLKKEFNGQMASGWGYSESVLIDGDKVVCTPGGDKGAILALDKKSGEEIWRCKELKDRAVYSSIIIAEVSGVKQYVQSTGGGVAGVRASDGKLLWHSNQNAHGIHVTTPVYHDNIVFVTTGYGVGCGAVKLTADGQEFKAEKLYANHNMTNHHGGVILLGEHVYGHSDSKGWVCQDLKSGDIAWNSNKLGKGSITYADGHFYCFTEGDGTCALIEATPDAWKEKGRFKIPQTSRLNRQGQVWTHPVVANGRLYLRDNDLLYCYDVKEGQ